MSNNYSTLVFLGLGANIDPKTALHAGIKALLSSFNKVQLSPVYRTKAIGIDGPDFLNMVVCFECHLDLPTLRTWIDNIEAQNGRIRVTTGQDVSHGLDMDILLFGDKLSPQDNIPRGDIWHKAYVLKPLADLAPKLVCPSETRTVAALWRDSKLNQTIAKVSFNFATS